MSCGPRTFRTRSSRRIDDSRHVLHVLRKRFKTNCKLRSLAPRKLCSELHHFVDFVTEKLIKTMMEVQKSLAERHVSLLPREITFISDPMTNLSALGFKFRNRRSVLGEEASARPPSSTPRAPNLPAIYLTKR